MRKLCILFLLGLGIPGAASAQARGSLYLALDHWTIPYIEHWIDLEVIEDPSPLVRPFTRRNVLRALEAADTTELSAGHLRTLQRLLRYFRADGSTETSFRTDLSSGFLSSTHARRTSVRDSGIGDTWVRGHVGLSLVHGPLAIHTRPSWDYRLRDDPDYFGITEGVDRPPTRFKEAYISVTSSFGDIAFGAVDRNWGPNFVEGILVSSSPFSYDHFSANLGSEKVQVGLIATQLDDFLNTAGETVHRYWVARKLYLRLPLHLTIELWEGSLFSGVDRSFEPWFLNPLKISEFERQDQGGLPINSIIGGDLELAWPGYPKFYLSLEVDDFPSGTGDAEPTSGAMITGFEGRLFGLTSWTLFYTAVSTLSYRSNDPAETVMRLGTGLARNQSDYDQLTLRLTTMPWDAVILQPEITLVRQGEGDFRQPFPRGGAVAATPVLHQGLVEKLLRLSVSGRLDLVNDVSARFEAAYHRFTDFEHVAGATEKRFVGSISVDYSFDRSFLPW